jgi:aminoglycoside phosphotransferase (APT) family kinase protein
VSDAEIAAALGVDRVTRQPWAYASSLPMERIDMAGAPSLLFKDLSGSARLPRPAFLTDRGREITAYTELLGGLDVDPPACHAAVVDDERAWLFLELVDGTPLWQSGELAIWEAAARRLAALHASPAPRRPGLLRYDAEHLRRRLALAGSLPAEIAVRVAERLARLPAVPVHGEFYASNVLVQRAAGRLRIRPVDWETFGTGPGALDVAALTAGSWDAAARTRIERAYLEACPEELRPTATDLDDARLVLAAQMLGWSSVWAPPPEHRQDWQRLTAELMERVGS